MGQMAIDIKRVNGNKQATGDYGGGTGGGVRKVNSPALCTCPCVFFYIFKKEITEEKKKKKRNSKISSQRGNAKTSFG